MSARCCGQAFFATLLAKKISFFDYADTLTYGYNGNGQQISVSGSGITKTYTYTPCEAPAMHGRDVRIEIAAFVMRLSQKRKLAEATHICRLFHMISCAYTGRVGKANIQWKEVGEIYGKQL